MNRYDNPFHDLWITEILEPGQFVKMFSPCLVSHAEELFGAGNVVVRGQQGSGKSMLLGLLGTRTRVAYARSGEGYPAAFGEDKKFIAAGIHLIRDNARIVISRLSEIPEAKRRVWGATTFADYVNYILVADLLENIQYLFREQEDDGVLKSELPIDWSAKSKDILVKDLKKQDVWAGFFDDCLTMDQFFKKVVWRLTEYRRYFNFNVDALDESIETSKTAIGQPVAALAESLRRSGVIPKSALVFLRIDQHEELYEIERSSGYSGVFRQVINQALAMRDGRVAYRVGTRHYAWNSDLTVWGSGASLENMRDYSFVDIDKILRPHESNALKDVFKGFAEDVFYRRLNAYGFSLDEKGPSDVLASVFGKTLSPADRARLYVKEKTSILKLPEIWSQQWKETLTNLWRTDPLDAKFGEAWLRQRSQQVNKIYLSDEPASLCGWRSRPYWRKERNEAALVQIAGDTREMLIWSGRRHLVDLAGGNVLAFMTICKSIWAAWLRSTSTQNLVNVRLPQINMDQQVIGVYEASKIWAEKLKEGSEGASRSAFINALGAWISVRLREDRALSNPGHTGFSLYKRDYDRDEFICKLIKTCRDHGDLIESEHTTKSSDGLPRVKWYLNPLLCPYFRIPHVRTKEPIYTDMSTLTKLFKRSRTAKRRGAVIDDDPQVQTELF